MQAELRLNDAARLLSMDCGALRKLLKNASSPLDLRRRPRPPHWRLDSHHLIEHLCVHHPLLAGRLMDRLRSA